MSRMLLLLTFLIIAVPSVAAPPPEAPWHGKWIWLKGMEKERNFYLYARRTFDLKRVPKTAPTRITVDTRYMLWVNGRFVGRGPVRSDPAWLYYDKFDLAPYLKPGRNVIAVLVEHYGEPTFQYVNAPAGLLFEANVGEGWILSDGSWKVHRADPYNQDIPKMDLQLPANEEFDARKEPVGWRSGSFNDSRWPEATIMGLAGMPPHVNLIARDIPHLREQMVKPAKWMGTFNIEPLAPAPQSFYVDLLPFMDPKTYGEAYALTTIQSEKPQRIHIAAGSDDGMKMWVNRKLVISHHIHRAAAPDQEIADVNIPAGRSTILMKTHQGGAGWEFYFRAAGADGKPLENFIETPRPMNEGVIKHSDAWFAIGPFDNPEKDEGEGGTGGFDIAYGPEKDQEAFLDRSYPGKTGPVQWKRVQSRPMQGVNKPVSEQMQSEKLTPRIVGAEFAALGVPIQQDIVRPTAVVYDMGREMLGFPRLKIRATVGTVVDIGYSELLENGRVVPNRAGVHYADRYICRDGDQEYNLFTPRAFRYVQVDVHPAKPGDIVVLGEFEQNYATYPVEYKGSFECSDDTLNRIWKLGRYTVQQCMEDAYTDCPWRERGQWWGDARAEAFTTYYAFGDARLIRKAILQVSQGQWAEGITPGVWPASFNTPLPDFCLIWVMTIDDYTRFTGDMSLATQLYPKVVKALKWFDQFNGVDNLLHDVPYWVFIDWAGLDKDGAVTALNAFYVGAADAAANLARRLGKSADVTFWENAARVRRRAINERLWSAKEGAYMDSEHADGGKSAVFSEQANSLCVLYNVATGVKVDSIFKRFAEDQQKPTVRCGSPYFSFYWLWAMHQAGRHQEAVDYARRHWKVMLDAGATTAWEVWSQQNSLCHGWSSCPTSLLPAWVLGIKPVEDGYKAVEIKPETAGLSWAKGAVPTPRGVVKVEWKREKKFTMRIEAPKGMQVQLALPYPPGSIHFGGGIKAVPSQRGRLTITSTGKPIVLETDPL
jgi:alpha-L-rhamnosidase